MLKASPHAGLASRPTVPELHAEQELKLTRARLDVLDRIFLTAERFAVERRVLCAGDAVHDEPCPDAEWWEQGLRLRACQKRKWKDRPVFLLLPGNLILLSSESHLGERPQVP